MSLVVFGEFVPSSARHTAVRVALEHLNIVLAFVICIVEQGKRCPSVPYLVCVTIQYKAGRRYGNVKDLSGLEKRPKRRNDTFAKAWARNNNNMCIWGRNDKKQ